MTPATSASERKLKRAVLERDQAREEIASLKATLAQSRSKARAAASESARFRKQQAAAAEVLAIVSRSAADTNPVFQGIVDSLVRLFPGFGARIVLKEGKRMVTAAVAGEADRGLTREAWPTAPIDRNYLGGLAILDKKPVVVDDAATAVGIPEAGRQLSLSTGNRASLIVPLLHKDEAIGYLAIVSGKPYAFGKEQVALLQTFAGQAVIAIENARLFKELQETIQYQRATSDVLRIVSSSVADARPVFAAIHASVLHLFEGFDASVWIVNNDRLDNVAYGGPTGEGVSAQSMPLDRDFGYPVLDCKVLKIENVESDTTISEAFRSRLLSRNRRSTLVVPLVRNDKGIGVIGISRTTPTPFTDKQIALLQTFADQAVIAIENARLFNELDARNNDLAETLRYQSATSDVLRIVSSSVADAQPVHDAIVASMLPLFEGLDSTVWLLEGEQLFQIALGGPTHHERRTDPSPVTMDSWTGSVILEGKVQVIEDGASDPGISEFLRQRMLKFNRRAVMAVPLLRQGKPIGALSVSSSRPTHFSEKQVALLRTFADQAVIAIQNAQLFRELESRNKDLAETLEQQTATSEVLRIISRSPTDTKPVFDAILENANRLCDAHIGLLGLYDGKMYQTVAQRGANAEFAKWVIDRGPFEPAPELHLARMIAERQPVYVPDYMDTAGYRDRSPMAVGFVEMGGARTYLPVPLLKEGAWVGGLTIYLPEVRPFTQRQIELVTTFASQAVIAIENTRLFNELEARNKDLAETLDQQTATADILRVISSSPTDLQPVFDAITASAKRLFDAPVSGLWTVEDDMLHIRSYNAVPEVLEAARRTFPRRVDQNPMLGRIIRDRVVLNVPDTNAEEVSEGARRTAAITGCRSSLNVPLLRGGLAIGALNVHRVNPGGFTEREVSLLKTFADQAVIAIGNVNLFKELDESLRYQTATGDVLKIVSSSVADAQPVFEAILASVLRMFEGFDATVWLLDGDHADNIVQGGPTISPQMSARQNLSTIGAWQSAIFRECKAARIEDVATDAGISEMQRKRLIERRRGALMGVPLARQGKAIGAITISRTTPMHFSDRQQALLQTFADQAVIAIENARLFKELDARNRELDESLRYQTATSEVLRIVSGSVSDAKPVFDSILASVQRLFEGFDVAIWLVENDQVVPVAAAGPTLHRMTGAYALNNDSVQGHSILQCKVSYILDAETDPGITESQRQIYRSIGRRTVVAVPLVREGKAFGSVSISRNVPTPVTDKQLALLQTFADQAVIAIQNARLFNELDESLRYQTATGDVLRIVGSSLSDAQPVFEAIAKSGHRLFDGANINISLVRDNVMHLAVFEGSETIRETLKNNFYPRPVDRFPAMERVVRDHKINIGDIEASDFPPEGKQAARLGGDRSIMAAPMLREDAVIGAIFVSRSTVGEFTDKQIALLQTFADQAVIAIENVRLFKELEASNREQAESLERQTATAEILRVISSSPTDRQPVFDCIAHSAQRLFDATVGVVLLRDGMLHAVAFDGDAAMVASGRRNFPRVLDRSSVVGTTILDRKVLNFSGDSGPDVPSATKDLVREGDFKSMMGAPMMREGAAIGAIMVASTRPGGFNDKQVALLMTFADQAVIAIENVRLFKELEGRNKDIAETLEQQTATSDVLRIISSSPTDTKPVFDAIADSLGRLFDGFGVGVVLVRGNQTETVATRGADYSAFPARALSRETLMGTAILDRKIICVPDAEIAQGISEESRKVMQENNRRSVLIAPLINEGEAIGVLGVFRQIPTDFTEKQIALLKTFADQAVIAMQNVHLFKELEGRNKDLAESLAQQTATGELLRAISRASFDLEALLQGLTATAAKLCDASRCTIFRPDAEGNYRPSVNYGYEDVPEALELLNREPLRVGRESAIGRALIERRPIQIENVAADADFRRSEVQNILKSATLLAVPMLRDGDPIGVITMTRGPEPRPFSAKQVELVTTFADQAVIAIENVRLIEEIQEKSAQLEIANRHKSEFLANMSHELRTPLNAIIGFSEVLSDKMFGEVNDKQLQYLKTIHSSGQHLLSLINDILDLAKIEAGRMELDLATFRLTAALDNALTLIKERAGRHGVALELQCDAELEDWTADERKFKQVMLNLLSNAVKFTPQGGKITVAAKRSGDGIEVSVTDTGVGIAPEDQQAVFEEFKQVGKDSKKKAEGTGLGLSLTKKFVELHGGKMRLASEPGKGSTFSFTLPEKTQS